VNTTHHSTVPVSQRGQRSKGVSGRARNRRRKQPRRQRSESRHRASGPELSPTLFGCNFPAGTTPPPPGATADGVYLMLAPSSVCSHVIHFGGEINVPSGQPGGPLDLIESINYMITVTAR
jgi:hypothetical protein